MSAPNKEKSNPANDKLTLPKGYKPMSSGTLRLEVPEKLGWHRHWFRGTPGRLAKARQAGYRYVDPDDVDINNFDLAGDSEKSGSTDLGTRVSVISGDGVGEDGQASRMYLMECPDELYEYSQSILAQQSDDIADALRGGEVGAGQSGESSKDIANRYIDKTRGKAPFTRRT